MLQRNDIAQSDSGSGAYSIRPPLNRAALPSEASEVDSLSDSSILSKQ